jgi:hypothetical protein
MITVIAVLFLDTKQLLSVIDDAIILVCLVIDGDLLKTRGQGHETRGLF